MWKTILFFEWRWLKGQPAVWIMLIFFVFLCLFSLNRGQSLAHLQQAEADSLQQRHQRAYAKLRAQFDTINFNGTQRAVVENPWTLDWQLGEYAIRPEIPFATLNIGQNDLTSRFKRTRFSTEIFSNEQDEFRNPLQLLSGHLDLAFVFLFLFPLLLIALTYNVYSANLELGTDKLIAAQSAFPVRILWGQLWYRWGVAFAPVIITLLISFWGMRKHPAFSLHVCLMWMGISLTYALLWLGIVRVVVWRGWSSMINMMTLTACWLLLLVALPGIINSVLQLVYPDTYNREVASLRDEKERFSQLTMKVHQDYFRSHYPEDAWMEASKDTLESKWASYAHMSIMREQEIHTLLADKAKRMMAAEQATFWINPAAAALRCFSLLSGSTLQQQFQFEQQVLELRRKKSEYLFGAFFSGGRLNAQEFSGIPRYAKSYSGPLDSIGYSWIPLLLLTLIVWLLPLVIRKGVYALNR